MQCCLLQPFTQLFNSRFKSTQRRTFVAFFPRVDEAVKLFRDFLMPCNQRGGVARVSAGTLQDAARSFDSIKLVGGLFKSLGQN